MKFAELALVRESVRRYSDKAVERSKINQCLEAARVAPSACNSQPWRFVVVDDSALCAKVASLTTSRTSRINSWVSRAPVLVAVIADSGNRNSMIGSIIGGKKYNVIDTSIAVENFCLQAADLGLGSCIIGWFREGRIKRLLKIPFGKKLLFIIALGYAETKKEPRKKVRKSIEEISSYNYYSMKKDKKDSAKRCDT